LNAERAWFDKLTMSADPELSKDAVFSERSDALTVERAIAA